jgi:formylglycine-generating enzyme required for sulfatase activity
MGTARGAGRQREPGELRHRVHLSRPFYLGQYEVTQSQWQAVMGENPSAFPSCGPKCPVERVSWNHVQVFLARLNRSTAAPALRLPTEAEWEYACRAGTSTPYSTGASLSSSQANFDARFPPPGSPPGAYRGRPAPVGSFRPNAWGLYDMHGNVWEWTADPFCPYSPSDVTDPRPSCAAEFKVIRGGSWYFDGNSCRCALRYTHRPADSGFSLGFRLARSVD